MNKLRSLLDDFNRYEQRGYEKDFIIEGEKHMEKTQIIENIKMDINNYFNELEGEEKFSGVTLVSFEDEKVINKGYGMANYELNIPNAPEMKYRVGSVTKQFTAVIIMKLYEKGLLNLEDTLDKYISDYPNGDKVTIHHLLTHTSGIFNSTRIEGFSKNMRNHHSVEELIEEFKYLPYDFQPGEKFSYSNSGYILLGYIIEKVSKKTYEECLQEDIFNKYSMNGSGYDNHKKIINNRVSGYSFDEEQNQLINCDFIDMSVPYAAGALYSTLDDLYTWNKKLIEGEVLSKDSLDKMLSNHVYTGNDYYGYGLFLDDVKLGGKTRKKVWHTGGIPGFLSCSKVFPKENIQIIMITNITSECFSSAVDSIEKIVFDELHRNNL